jgi:hypothetical protein
MGPTAALEVLLGLPPLHLVAETKASACRLSDKGMCLGRGSDTRHPKPTKFDEKKCKTTDKQKLFQ